MAHGSFALNNNVLLVVIDVETSLESIVYLPDDYGGDLDRVTDFIVYLDASARSGCALSG